MAEQAAHCGNQICWRWSRIHFPDVERVEKVTNAFGQRLFHHGLIGGPEASAKMGLLSAVHLMGHGNPGPSSATKRSAHEARRINAWAYLILRMPVREQFRDLRPHGRMSQPLVALQDEAELVPPQRHTQRIQPRRLGAAGRAAGGLANHTSAIEFGLPYARPGNVSILIIRRQHQAI